MNASIQAMVKKGGKDDGFDYFSVTMVIVSLYCICCVIRDLKELIGWWCARKQPMDDVRRDRSTSDATPTRSTPMTTTTSRIEQLWVTPQGDKFHVDNNCRGLRNARKVDKRSLCLICGD